MNKRILKISGLAILIAIVMGFVAHEFIHWIDFMTNVAFYWKWSFEPASPKNNHLGAFVILIPIAGSLIVGLMARYGSSAIRGHGIPEAMEQILFNQSRISPKVAFFKPLSAIVSIGTGGPFGAEGPIIATGGALGSLLGQFIKLTSVERKTLLAAGAAAGMTAVFGTPVAAVLLAIELLLFEYRSSSMIPVCFAAVAAMSVRILWVGSQSFATVLTPFSPPSEMALGIYIGMGVVFGMISILITKLLYWLEDQFEKLPLHWMWWPLLGGLAVGVIGWLDPRTLGIGYENMNFILNANFPMYLLLSLGVMKLISWSIALASGTSGGTLAPLFTIGGALGGALGMLIAQLFPAAGIDPRLAGLIGMAAVFTGASRAFLASVIFAFEITRQPMSLLPLLGSCAVSYLISSLFMNTTIMTEKISRRGYRVPDEYVPDDLDQVIVRTITSKHLVALEADNTVAEIHEWIASGIKGSTHQGFPVLDKAGEVLGVITLKDLMALNTLPDTPIRALIKCKPIVVYENNTVREAADIMVREKIGRLPVLSREKPHNILGMVTRSDVLSAHQHRLEANHHRQATLRAHPLFLKKLYRRFFKK